VSALKGGAAEFLTDVITRQLSTILDDGSGNEASPPISLPFSPLPKRFCPFRL